MSLSGGFVWFMNHIKNSDERVVEPLNLLNTLSRIIYWTSLIRPMRMISEAEAQMQQMHLDATMFREQILHSQTLRLKVGWRDDNTQALITFKINKELTFSSIYSREKKVDLTVCWQSDDKSILRLCRPFVQYNVNQFAQQTVNCD